MSSGCWRLHTHFNSCNPPSRPGRRWDVQSKDVKIEVEGVQWLTQDHHSVNVDRGICAGHYTGMAVRGRITGGLELESSSTFASLHALHSTRNHALIFRLTNSARLLWIIQFTVWDSRRSLDLKGTLQSFEPGPSIYIWENEGLEKLGYLTHSVSQQMAGMTPCLRCLKWYY